MPRISQQALQSLDELLVGAAPKKLDAEDYSTEDIDAVTEGAFSSGNLNYLLLQQQQTNDLQTLVQSKLLSDTALLGGLAAGAAFGAGTPVAPLSDGVPLATAGADGTSARLTPTNDDTARPTADGQTALSTGMAGALSPPAATAQARVVDVAQQADVGLPLESAEAAGASAGVGDAAGGRDGRDGTDGQNGQNGGTGPQGPQGDAGDLGGDGTSPLLEVTVDLPIGEHVVLVVQDIIQDLTTVLHTLLDGGVPVLPDVVSQVLETLGDTLGLLTATVNDLLLGEGVDLSLSLKNLLDLDVTLGDGLTLATDLTIGLETGIPFVDSLLQTVDEIADITLPVGDILTGLLGGGTPDGDTDLALNIGVGDLSLNTDVLLDPVEAVLGDIDIGLNLNLNDGLDVANLLTIEADNPVLDGVGDVVGGVLGGVDTLLSGGNADGDTDLALNIGVGDLTLNTDVLLDPVEAVLGDIDIGLNLNLNDGLDVANLLTIEADNPVLDGVGDAVSDVMDSVSTLLAPLTQPLGEVTQLAQELDLTDVLGGDDGLLGTLGGALGAALPEPLGSVDDGLPIVSKLTVKGFGGSGLLGMF
jgi:hypothetical protein